MDSTDLFSINSDNYEQYRPNYPKELFQTIADACPVKKAVWDCATGNGQAALALTHYFDTVYATDASTQQIQAAQKHPHIEYSVATAKNSELNSHSVNCITVAQGLHWFANEEFFSEVRRVAADDAILAAWCYPQCRLKDNTLNQAWDEFYGVIRPYFPQGREHVDNTYADITLPVSETHTQHFQQHYQWSKEHFLKYIKTWSAYHSYCQNHSDDPVDHWQTTLLDALWPNQATQDITFDIVLHWGNVT